MINIDDVNKKNGYMKGFAKQINFIFNLVVAILSFYQKI